MHFKRPFSLSLQMFYVQSILITAVSFCRSNSALGIPIAALPDRPESPAPKDWKPAPPGAPKQAPSSPRVRRSSSFSKVSSTVSKIKFSFLYSAYYSYKSSNTMILSDYLRSWPVTVRHETFSDIHV